MTENIIDEFLSNYNKKNTIRGYRKTLNDYFSVLNIENPDNYFKSDRNYKEDVKKYCNSLIGKSAGTFIHRITTVKGFFEEYEQVFPKKEVKKFRLRNDMKRISPVVRDRVFSRSELKQILSHGGLKEKALFLTLASSGMRIGEALHIKPDDINFDNDPVIITIRREYTKSKEKRVTFISKEATDYLKQWLKVKDEYLEKYSHCIKNIDKNLSKKRNDTRVFPFTAKGGAWKMLVRMLKNSGYDKKVEDLKNVDRYEFHLHSFRKFFRTNLAVEMPVDMVESLMGHSGYLTSSYRRFQDNPSLMFKPYKKAVHMITIFSSTVDVERVNDIEKENKRLNEELQKLRSEMGKMIFEHIKEYEKQKG